MSTKMERPGNQQEVWHMQDLALSRNDIHTGCTEPDPKQLQISNPPEYPHSHTSIAQPEQRVSQQQAIQFPLSFHRRTFRQSPPAFLPRSWRVFKNQSSKTG